MIYNLKKKIITIIAYDKASELFNKLLEIYFHKYNDLSDAEKKNRPKYDLVNLMFDKCYCKKGIKKN